MKSKSTKLISIILSLTLIFVAFSAVPAYAGTTDEATAADYQAAFDALAEEYNLTGKLSATITEVPDESLESFTSRYEGLFSSIAPHIVEKPSIFETNSIKNEQVRNNAILRAADDYWNLNDSKTCSAYFRVYYMCRKVNNTITDVYDPATRGTTTFFGNLSSFSFVHKTNLSSHRYNSDGTANIYCTGTWYDMSAGVTTVFADPYTLVVVAD